MAKNTKPKPNKPNKPNQQQEKADIKAELKQKIDEELYKLQQDVIINRMSTRDELFGDNNDLSQLLRSMEKHDKRNAKEDDKKTPKKDKPKKINIELKLLEREK
jgi:hypothetical protein